MIRESNVITGWHAHIYYHTATKPAAARLRTTVEARFEMHLGQWNDNPIGPHLSGSYQITFEPRLFGDFVPWLMLNRGELTIFVHPLTGDDLVDHDALALWLGPPEDLNFKALQPTSGTS